MKRSALLIALVALVATGLSATAGAATTHKRPLRSFEGTVVSVDKTAKTFRLHDAERGTRRIRVNANTRYSRLAGLSALKAGQTGIEVKTRRRVDGAWLALRVERSGGGGRHGGDDDKGGDDHGGGGSDDPPNHQ